MAAGEGLVSDERGAISYTELREAETSWDAWLTESGVSSAECVALPARTDARSAVALLALLRRGQSVLLWRQPIVSDGDLLLSDSLPPFCTTALVHSDADAAHEALVAGPVGHRIVRRAASPGARLEVGLPHVYLQTSGTTGTPKIVAHELNALWANARNCLARLQLSSADRVMIPVPLAHMYGLGAAFLPAFLAGASVRLVPDANLLTYVRAEADFEPTVTFITPNFCHLLVKGRRQDRRYRLTVIAGDAADEQTFEAYERRHGCTINLYGSTELGAICAGSPDDPFIERRDTVGMPLPGVRTATPETEDAPPLGPSDEPFPLRFDHPYGCAGYAGDDGLPVKPPSLYEDGWYKTMDLGRIDAHGRLQLAGRFDDTVKRDGFLVAFADVERALQRLDAIERAVVVPGGMTPRGRELVAVCTPTANNPLDGAVLRRLALEHLPAYAVPDRFVFIDSLPLTATSKPDRRALAAMVA